MSRDERLLAGPGFAVFTRRPAFAAETVLRYLALDPGARHVVLIHHAGTDPALGDLLGVGAAARGVELLPIPWERYGDPDTVARVAAIPSEGLVFVSADHRRSVVDRLDKRRGYVRRKGARKRIVLDVVPYEVAPWRVFFPFAFFDRDLLGYHHSYALEQDHERFLDGQLPDDPCDAGRIADKTWRAAVVDGPAFFERRPQVREIGASADDHAAYAVERDRLFAAEKSITGVKSKLGRWIQVRYPTRAVPLDLRRVYAPDFATGAPIVHTDLPFDRWLVGEIAGLMDHTDALLGAYVQHQREVGE